MRRLSLFSIAIILGWLAFPASAPAVELRMSRPALERTLKQQLFSGVDGRYYLKGDAKSACSVYADQPALTFVQDRVVVQVRIHAKLGTSVGGKCLGFSLNPTAAVSLVPDAEGETLGFRDARVERVSDSKELNFLLMPFMKNQIPTSMRVDAAGVLRTALKGSTLSTGYALTLDRLKIHSLLIQGDWLTLDVDGDLSVQ